MPEITLIENWYTEPFSKRKTCEVPGQCGGDCDCGCPYNTMTEVENLPLIADITDMFSDEWLAFITAPPEDDDPLPTHGKLVAHSPDPDNIFDAVNTVLWNQCVYVFFNGDFEALKNSYGERWDEAAPLPAQSSNPTSHGDSLLSQIDPIPETLTDLIYSALDQLYQTPPHLNQAIQRLRLAKVRLKANPDSPLLFLLDQALDQLEGPTSDRDALIWALEDALVDLEEVRQEAV